MNIYPYRKEALEAIARKVISVYDPRLLDTPAPIPVDSIIEKAYGLTLEFQYIRNNGRILGETVFEDAMIPIYDRENGNGYKLVPVKAGTVIIDAGLLHNRGGGRFRFTCAHELAHWVLHKELYTSIGETAASSSRTAYCSLPCEDESSLPSSLLLSPQSLQLCGGPYKTVRSSETDAYIERQADLLGVYLLMPKGTLKKAFYRADGNADDKTVALSELFGVSRQAMRIRLEEMRLLT